MDRRSFITLIGGAAAWPLAAHAQRAGKRRVIGVLVGPPAAAVAGDLSEFLEGMHDLGYVENKDFEMVYRYGEGHFDRLPQLAQELIQLKPDLVLAAGGSPSVLAIKGISSTVPIVAPVLSDEVHLGLVESDARPGGNVTGLSVIVAGLTAKQLELAHDTLPAVQRFGLLVNAANQAMVSERQEAEASAPKLGVAIVTVQVRRPDEIGSAFEKISSEKCQAVIVPADGMFYGERHKLAALAAAARLPDIYAFRYHVAAGGMISYGVDQRPNFRRAASYVDKIWNGTPPGELPIEFPTKLELLINLKTAKAIGITIPPAIIVRADEVIE